MGFIIYKYASSREFDRDNSNLYEHNLVREHTNSAKYHPKLNLGLESFLPYTGMASNDSQEADDLLRKIKSDEFDIQSDFGSVINLLRSERDAVRRKATLCFEKIAKEYPIETRNKKSHILQRLEDEDTAVRAGSLSVLKNLAEEYPEYIHDDLPDIIDRIQDEPYVRKNALEATRILAKEYPEDVQEYIPQILEATESGDQSISKLASESIVQVTEDKEILQEAKENVEGDAKEVIEEKLSEITDRSNDSENKDEDKVAYQEASSIELPDEYRFKDQVNQGDYFELSIDAGSERIQLRFRLTSDTKRKQNYCRAISSNKVYLPISIFASIGLHDNQVEWLGFEEEERVLLGQVTRSAIQTEVPISNELEKSRVNRVEGQTNFNVKLDLDGGHKPEAVYLDIIDVDGDIGISATPVKLDEAARDLPNVSSNIGQAKDTLQFCIPHPIARSTYLDDENEFLWFMQDDSLILVFSDEYTETAQGNNTDTGVEKKEGSKRYKTVEGFLDDIGGKTLPSQRKALRKKINNPDLTPLDIVENPEIKVTNKVIEEVFDEYEDVIHELIDTTNSSEKDTSTSNGGQSEVTKKELLDAIEEVGEEIGERPRLKDMEQRTPYKQSDYYRNFESWTSALEKVGYEYETHNTKEDVSTSGQDTEESVPQRAMTFSEEGVKINERVEKHLSEGQTEVTVEELSEDSFPIEDIDLHVTAVEAGEGEGVRLYFNQRTENGSDINHLLYFTDKKAELREIREKVFGEGEEEVTIEEISWDEKISENIEMQVSNIKLQDGDLSMPVLELTSINKSTTE